MNKEPGSIKQSFYDNRFALILFATLSLLTALVVAAVPEHKLAMARADVQVNTQLSQSKIVKAESSTLYLDVNINTPAITEPQGKQPASDIIVLLDRSGSMSGANKMAYAKVAITDLLNRLTEQDRFALVTFSNDAMLHSALQYVRPQQRQQLNQLLQSIQPGGGTNMSAGLQQVINLLHNKPAQRASKVLLLSDGQANQGITDITGLSQMVAQITNQQSVLSSIGMGLDFNETLMSSLSDYGMGSYAYLENLATLGDIFAQSLNATRSTYAAHSEIILDLHEGVELVDVAGYPVSKDNDALLHIKTGQLLNAQNKQFVMTFKVNAPQAEHMTLGNMLFSYQQQGKTRQYQVPVQNMTLTLVEPVLRKQAVASIDKDVYKQSWLKNNLGRMKKEVSHWLRAGNKQKADRVISEYRQEVAEAEQTAAMPIASAEMDDQLNDLQRSVEDAFSGDVKEQKQKRKRAAKRVQMQSLNSQRSVK